MPDQSSQDKATQKYDDDRFADKAERISDQLNLNDSFDNLYKVLENLSEGFKTMALNMKNDTDARLQDTRERKRAGKRFVGMGVALGILIGATLGVSIYNHENPNSSSAAKIAEDCVDVPAHLSPVGTPYAKLTCYERSQIEIRSALNDVATYNYNLVKAAMEGKTLPLPFVPLTAPKTN